jgi:D-cysteine desulfhydrase
MSSPEPTLFRRFPFLRDRVPWTPLASIPTPVEPLSLPGVGGELWIKRDDRSGLPYGGNKVRKLEFLLGRARARGAGRLITAGALGSHHALATAVYGRVLDLPVTLCLSPQRPTEEVRRSLLLAHALGSELVLVPRMELIPAAMAAQRILWAGDRPFVVPPGGSDSVGSLGYVNAALELAEQVDRFGAARPPMIHMACGTMGTAAGLAAGFALAGMEVQIRAVRVVGRLVAREGRLRRLATATLRFLRGRGVATPPPMAAHALVELDHDHLGEGYGRITPQAEAAMEQFARVGIELDPTYTGKAAAGLLASMTRWPDRLHLFWHTLSAVLPEPEGGLPDPRSLPSRFHPFFDLGAG